MNKYYSKPDFFNQIKSIKFNISVILLKCFVKSLRMRHGCTMNRRRVYLQTGLCSCVND